jgi:hypothetical protein
VNQVIYWLGGIIVVIVLVIVLLKVVSVLG